MKNYIVYAKIVVKSSYKISTSEDPEVGSTLDSIWRWEIFDDSTKLLMSYFLWVYNALLRVDDLSKIFEFHLKKFHPEKKYKW